MEELPIPGTEKPSVEDIRAWFTSQWDRWRAKREQDEAVRSRIYRKRLSSGTGPNGEEEALNQVPVLTGVARTLLREFTGILSNDHPRVQALGNGLGPKANLEAEKIELWDAAWWEDVGGDDKQQLIDSDQVAYGRGVSYRAWARQFWASMPQREEDEDAAAYLNRVADWKLGAPQPIHWEHCPAPQTMFDDDIWAKSYGPPRCVFWQHRDLSEIALEYPKSEAARKWEAEKSRDGATQDRKVLFLTFANRRWMAYAFADGQVAETPDEESQSVALLTEALEDWDLLAPPFEHGAGRNPFVVQLGDISSDPSLVHKYAGLFDNSLPLIDAIDDLLTQYHSGLRRYARAQPIVTRQWGPAGQVPYGYDPNKGTVREIKWNPGKVLSFGPGELPGWWHPEMGDYQAAIDFHTILSQYVQRDTLAPSIGGGAAGPDSGYQLVTLIQSAELKLKGLFRRKSHAIEEGLTVVHRLVVHIDSDVPVMRATDADSDAGTTEITNGYIALTPKQAKVARVRVKVSPRLDSAKAANAQLGIQLAQAVQQKMLDIDKDWIAEEFIGIENPEKHRQAAVIQRFLQNPELDNWVTQYVLQKAQMMVKKEEADQVQQLAQLSPEQLMLVPAALRSVLEQRQLMAPGLQAPQGLAGGDGGSGFNSLVSANALPSTPPPGVNVGQPGAAPSNAVQQYTGGQGVNVNQLSALLSAQAAGQPVSPGLAGG